jgi:hypothetical protein
MDMPDLRPLYLFKLLRRPPKFCNHRPGVAKQRFPEYGKLQPPRTTIEQLRTYDVFEDLDALAQRLNRYVECLGRTPERPVINDSQEMDELAIAA